MPTYSILKDKTNDQTNDDAGRDQGCYVKEVTSARFNCDDPLSPCKEDALFEQGLHEGMRLALRLEHLFKQFDYYISTPCAQHARGAMRILLSILEVSKRADLKSKIIQALTQQTIKLRHLSTEDELSNPQHVNILTEKLHKAINLLHGKTGRIGDAIHENEFLSSLKLQFNSLGGGSDDTIPTYALWLTKPADELIKDLEQWFKFCRPLPEIIHLLLAVTRQNQRVYRIRCEDGFYSQTLNSNAQYQIMRLKIAKNLLVYPEVSVGKHRLSIRFVHLKVNDQGKGQQVKQPLNFNLSLCFT